jgi:hypothetical protein
MFILRIDIHDVVMMRIHNSSIHKKLFVLFILSCKSQAKQLVNQNAITRGISN